MTRPGPDSEVSQEDIIEILARARTPVLGTSDIAEELPISRQATEKHLKRMVEAGYLETAMLGRTRIYWALPAGKDLLK